MRVYCFNCDKRIDGMLGIGWEKAVVEILAIGEHIFCDRTCCNEWHVIAVLGAEQGVPGR